MADCIRRADLQSNKVDENGSDAFTRIYEDPNDDDLKGIHDAVFNAAKTDQSQSVEKWGPAAFCRRLRTKLHTTQLQLEPYDRSSKGAPRSLNIILLGPAGAGKSSLIYTWWRALSGSSFHQEEDGLAGDTSAMPAADDSDPANAEEALRRRPSRRGGLKGPAGGRGGVSSSRGGGGSNADEHRSFMAHHAHHSLMQRLALGWTVEEALQNYQERTGDLNAMPRHGTSCFNAVHLTPVTDISCGIAVHDTKGQSFFTQAEEQMAEQLLKGKLLPGSTEEKKMYRYWFMLGLFGFLAPPGALRHAPHAVVLVFDLTLRSFGNMLIEYTEGTTNELTKLYQKVIQRAEQQGQTCFVALTHLDQFRPGEDDVYIESVDLEEGKFDRARDMPAVVAEIKEKLAAALAGDEGDARRLGPERIFAVENYRQGKYLQDPVLDLSVLEFLDNVVESANYFVSAQYKPQGSCLIS